MATTRKVTVTYADGRTGEFPLGVWEQYRTDTYILFVRRDTGLDGLEEEILIPFVNVQFIRDAVTEVPAP